MNTETKGGTPKRTFYRIIARNNSNLNGRHVEWLADCDKFRVTTQPIDSTEFNPAGRPIVFDMTNKWEFVEVRRCPYIGVYDPDVWCPLDHASVCDKCPKHPSNRVRPCKYKPSIPCGREFYCAVCPLCPIIEPCCPTRKYCPECGKKL